MKNIITFLLLITICGCNIKDNYYTEILPCVIDSAYVEPASFTNGMQTNFVYKTSCGFKIYGFEPNVYKKKDTVYVKKVKKKEKKVE